MFNPEEMYEIPGGVNPGCSRHETSVAGYDQFGQRPVPALGQVTASGSSTSNDTKHLY